MLEKHDIKLVILLALSPCIMAASCNNRAPTLDNSWERVLSSCGVSDLQKSKPLYFGAANKNGVGSIWSKDVTTGDYYPTSQFSDITSQAGIVFNNVVLSCSGEAKSGIDFSVGVSAKPVIYPVSGEISNALSTAKSAKVSVESIVEEDAYWDKFNSAFSALPADGSIKKGVELNNRVVVGRAWKIKGFHAVLTYQGSDALTAKAALDAKVASASLNVATKLTGDNTLEVSSSDELYVAGVFRKLSPSGVSAGLSGVSDWEELPTDAIAGPPR
ncbi:hypothetical protein AWB67_02275 [Caballeronia terrestris]|uniref:Lipoprotein n=1 Tax=Caballeronia terrestris TaxID=1226301 RepID=A0A158HZL8_9BURK|nr:hypothetical protein [Caballeronia terrestris]SAL49814.1 hypothetical protein AWB67_02275 [Caballeronia terrestris]